MTPSKERLRKLHGVIDSTTLIEQAVFARRAYHEAAIKWLARWSTSLQISFALIGLLFVLLPTIINDWRVIVEKIPIAAHIFRDFSSLSGSAMILFFFLMTVFLIWNSLKNSLPARRTPFLTYRDIAEMELYPQNRKEELAFWVDFILATSGTTLWLFMPFGVLAYFIKIGG